MSHRLNQAVSTWKVIEEFLSRCTPTHYSTDGKLSIESRLIVKDAYFLWYLCTLDTLTVSENPFQERDQIPWLKAVVSVPVLELVESLKLVNSQLVVGNFSCYDTFKQYLRDSYSFIGAVIAPMKGLIDRWFREDDSDALNLLFSWSCFITRLNLPGLDELEQDALRKYLLIEDNLQEGGFSSEEKILLEQWFPRNLTTTAFFIENYRPSHGPGSTADSGDSLIQKYLNLGTDTRISMLIRRVYGSEPAYPRECSNTFKRISSTIFVPKSLTAYRTISMEPASLMWHQKGVRSSLFAYISKHVRKISRRFQPEEQEPNRYYAWLGSLDGSFATIDLSSASDTVSWSLVQNWLGHTSLYPWLLWTRSTRTKLPDGSEIKLKKFAPMGSDLCFPIETILFIAMAECAIVESGGNPELSRFCVYGDDIVIEEQYVPALIRRLTQNGFFVNYEKSFSGQQPKGFFRESCGGYYFNGDDITPVRLSRKFSGYSKLGEDKPQMISSLIDFANECNTRYPSVRRFLIISLLRLPKTLRPPFSGDGAVGLFSTQPSNFHLKSKESVRYQTIEYTFGCTHQPKHRSRRSWEDIRLFEYLRQTDGRKRLTWPEDRVIAIISPNPEVVWKTKRSPLYG